MSSYCSCPPINLFTSAKVLPSISVGDARRSALHSSCNRSVPNSSSSRSNASVRPSVKKSIESPGLKSTVTVSRSEEHTSELQSHLNLVCRLLLEKKKQIQTRYNPTLHPRQLRAWR